ncbi:MAG: ABC transporter ATP-binding protein [Bacteroidia bacterium]|nr:ABC transporter ATP-binding protein [Bacteroidia bacterium]MDW8015223.1 ABC transporter ATP-binding protein [Bacteroidia bacterium]
MPEPLLHAAKLRKAYQNRPILDGVDIELSGGRFHALVGHSGSGKTTLLYILALLEEPDAGEIYWRGRLLHTLSTAEKAAWRNANVGFVFQFFHLIAELKVWENVALPAILQGSSFRQQKARALEWLERVGMRERAEDRPTHLSGGEQQRVAIARALFLSPPLLLADEPTGNLDTEQAHQIWQLFLTLARQTGAAVLVATHNLTLAQSTDSVFALREGKLFQNP